MYPRKTHYNMREAWTLEVILTINLKRTWKMGGGGGGGGGGVMLHVWDFASIFLYNEKLVKF